MHAPADNEAMGRTLGLPLLLVSLVVGGFLFIQQSKTEGPTAPAVTRAEAQAYAAGSQTTFNAALPVVDAWFADHATYAGLALEPSFQVTVVRADATSYCLQTGVDPNVSHLEGPGGQPQTGPC
jgi:hypothetical protein